MSPNEFKQIIKDAPWLECPQGNKTFEKKVIFKRMSALISPSGNEELMPVEIEVCSKCGKVPKILAKHLPPLPEEFIADCDSEEKGSLILS